MNNKSITIPWGKPHLTEQAEKYVNHAVKSGWIGSGPYIEEFTQRFTDMQQIDYGVPTCNGTSAILLALLGLGLKDSDEVIVPGYTFAAPINMIMAVKAKPVFVDIDPLTWAIDPEQCQKAVTQNTKAILAMHPYGNPCDMSAICKIADENNLTVIEDVAQSCFSQFDGKYTGTLGHIGAFSFHATKTITTGEGGMVVTKNKELFELMSNITRYGMCPERKYWHNPVGYNLRMNNLSAAIGCAQLDDASNIIEKKQRNEEYYRQHLLEIPEISMQKSYAPSTPLYWSICVKLKQGLSTSRDDICQKLLDKGIETRPGFFSYHEMPGYGAPFLAHTDDLCKNLISLPSFTEITKGEMNRVVQGLKESLV